MVATKRKAGRPTKFTADLGLTIAERVGLGYSRTKAARFAGIDPATLKRWFSRGKADITSGVKSELAAFVGMIQDVEAELRTRFCKGKRIGSRLPGRIQGADRPQKPRWSISATEGSTLDGQLVDLFNHLHHCSSDVRQ